MQLQIARKRFFFAAIGDVLRALDGRSLIGAMALSTCVIDYLASLVPTKGKNGDNYRAFVTNHLLPLDNRYNSSWIYAVRCALVHTYAESNAMAKAVPPLTGGYLMSRHYLNPDFHLNGPAGRLHLSIEPFVADIIWLTYTYFELIAQDPAKTATVEAACDRLLVVKWSDKTADMSYTNMHPILSLFDHPNPSRANLVNDISAHIQAAYRKFPEQ